MGLDCRERSTLVQERPDQYANTLSQAAFQTLCRLDLAEHVDLPGPGIMITVCAGIRPGLVFPSLRR